MGLRFRKSINLGNGFRINLSKSGVGYSWGVPEYRVTKTATGMVNQNEGKLIPLKVDEVEPTKENIANGSYKISRPLIVVKKGELTKEQQAFMDVVISEKSSEIIEKMGFVPVN